MKNRLYVGVGVCVIIWVWVLGFYIFTPSPKDGSYNLIYKPKEPLDILIVTTAHPRRLMASILATYYYVEQISHIDPNCYIFLCITSEASEIPSFFRQMLTHVRSNSAVRVVYLGSKVSEYSQYVRLYAPLFIQQKYHRPLDRETYFLDADLFLTNLADVRNLFFNQQEIHIINQMVFPDMPYDCQGRYWQYNYYGEDALQFDENASFPCRVKRGQNRCEMVNFSGHRTTYHSFIHFIHHLLSLPHSPPELRAIRNCQKRLQNSRTLSDEEVLAAVGVCSYYHKELGWPAVDDYHVPSKWWRDQVVLSEGLWDMWQGKGPSSYLPTTIAVIMEGSARKSLERCEMLRRGLPKGGLGVKCIPITAQHRLGNFSILHFHPSDVYPQDVRTLANRLVPSKGHDVVLFQTYSPQQLKSEQYALCSFGGVLAGSTEGTILPEDLSLQFRRERRKENTRSKVLHALSQVISQHYGIRAASNHRLTCFVHGNTQFTAAAFARFFEWHFKRNFIRFFIGTKADVERVATVARSTVKPFGELFRTDILAYQEDKLELSVWHMCLCLLEAQVLPLDDILTLLADTHLPVDRWT